MGLHLRSVLTSLLVVVLSVAPALATVCVVCCDPDVAHGAHASAATTPSHGSHAAEPPPAAPKAEGEGGAHCTQTRDRVDAGRSPWQSPHQAPRIAAQERACSVPLVEPATVRTAGRSDVQHITPSPAPPVRVTWNVAWQPSPASVTARPPFPPLARSRTPLNLRI